MQIVRMRRILRPPSVSASVPGVDDVFVYLYIEEHWFTFYEKCSIWIVQMREKSWLAERETGFSVCELLWYIDVTMDVGKLTNKHTLCVFKSNDNYGTGAAHADPWSMPLQEQYNRKLFRFIQQREENDRNENKCRGNNITVAIVFILVLYSD